LEYIKIAIYVLKRHVLLHVAGRHLLGFRTDVQEVLTPVPQTGGLGLLPG